MKDQEHMQTSQTMSGAKVLLKSLQKHGVELVFGYPGGAVLPLYDALYDAEIPNILTRHEQGAVHAAEGYAKATGKPGVVIVTSGPGATNVVTGIADAMGDSIPLVVFTGQVATPGIGKDAFQEADILGITLPITKHNYQVRDVDELEKIIDEAFHIATTGRKGPVVIDLPKDISIIEGTYRHRTKPVNLISYQPTVVPSQMQINRLMEQLKKAKKPIVLAGAGVTAANAAQELQTFVERYKLPTVTTLLGLGTVPANFPYFLGMGGMHGSYAANMALAECDLLINIGSRFDDRLATCPSQFATGATIAHIDIDPAEIGKIIKTDIPIVGDAKKALEQLLTFEPFDVDSTQWQELCQQRKARYPFTFNREDQSEIKPQRVIEKVGEITKGQAFVSTDVGQHQMWVAQYYPFNFPNQLITSGGLGTMGFGIPAGIGAQFAYRDRPVVVFVGDGGFQMTNQEFAILNENGLNVKFVLINNGSLGMVRQWQESFHNERRSSSVFSGQPDFIKLADAYGIDAVRISNPATLDDELEEAFAKEGPMLIEVIVSNTEHVMPMVPAGIPNDQMIGVE
ncbi:biosynthetic-type acetolactate synthase large subunit [Enterococcus saccharolyticus]|uniref:Acetolactate synthase n=2 Tax=Enterococcus TaxID=1350 RepID=A0ABQ6Z202_9ENTE|nr:MULTISPECIES: biosynthetic-type acetolactate synthase large subunit [Enterococcus]KAF1305457.1 acetolactate synthase, large subunit, biosynthetic type [Enterococcus sp. CU12B]MCD5002790.1 biosynthetic-type acetolactate synthase large subunit [Enterococcus saccharolyticus]